MQTLLADSGLPFSFWGWAICTAQYLRNHLPTSVLPSNITPYKCYHNKKPDLSHLHVWGCQCFVLIPLERRSKGGPHRFKPIFVGYNEDRIGWYVCDMKNANCISPGMLFSMNLFLDVSLLLVLFLLLLLFLFLLLVLSTCVYALQLVRISQTLLPLEIWPLHLVVLALSMMRALIHRYLCLRSLILFLF